METKFNSNPKLANLKIKFWGVRGSKPTPGRNTILFGGNTSCVEIEAGGRTLIFDAGTGIVELGNQLTALAGGQGIQADIFFSHLHWDHIQGLPFFTPLYAPGNKIRLYGEDKCTEGMTFQQVIEKQMRPPHFPITMKMMKSDYEFINLNPGGEISIAENITIKTFPVNHPNGCLAYRVESGGSAVVYATDTEPFEDETAQKKFLDFIGGADVLIYDTHFTDDEYFGNGEDHQSKKKWGHSTWQEGTRISKAAGVSWLVLYHHKENRSDRDQQEIEIIAGQEFENTVAAREGMTITVGGGDPEKVVINYPY